MVIQVGEWDDHRLRVARQGDRQQHAPRQRTAAGGQAGDRPRDTFSPRRLPNSRLSSSPIRGQEDDPGRQVKENIVLAILKSMQALLLGLTFQAVHLVDVDACLVRKIATINARPTATSAAATVITKKTNIWPLRV